MNWKIENLCYPSFRFWTLVSNMKPGNEKWNIKHQACLFSSLWSFTYVVEEIKFGCKLRDHLQSFLYWGSNVYVKNDRV